MKSRKLESTTRLVIGMLPITPDSSVWNVTVWRHFRLPPLPTRMFFSDVRISSLPWVPPFSAVIGTACPDIGSFSEPGITITLGSSYPCMGSITGNDKGCPALYACPFART